MKFTQKEVDELVVRVKSAEWALIRILRAVQVLTGVTTATKSIRNQVLNLREVAKVLGGK